LCENLGDGRGERRERRGEGREIGVHELKLYAWMFLNNNHYVIF